MLARGVARVNQLDVLPLGAQEAAARPEVPVCLGLFSFGATATRECFSPGNEVLFSLTQWGIANVKILVVDDHVLIREALRGVLKELKGDATVLEASSCNQAMQVIAEHPDLDLILLDLKPARSRRFFHAERVGRALSGDFSSGTLLPAGPWQCRQGTRPRRARFHSEIGSARGDPEGA